ncbi:MAG TPA: hypothetical protein VFI24_28365 [Pyrinomonadaceae bacterium]|nr:hypothetical protein [Pyrinomonadaceae bacterium]
MKRFLQFMIVGVVLALWAPITYACFCVKPAVPDAYKRARAVFVGEVLEVTPPQADDPTGGFAQRAHTIRFKVERAWKGIFWTEVSVLARFDSCFDLQAAPRLGEKVLVYAEPVYPADESRKEVMIGACSRTALMSSRSVYTDVLFPDSLAEDIRHLDTLVMFAPRQNTPSVQWMKFLDP